MKFGPNINILVGIKGNLDQGPRFCVFFDFCQISNIFDIMTLPCKIF